VSIEKIGAAFLSAALATKVFDRKKPLWARVAYGAVAYDIVTTAFAQKPLFGLGGEASTPKPSGRVPLRFKEFRVRTIQDRVALVHQQMIQGTRDPKIYALAREVLTRRCGDDWCVPAGTMLVTDRGELPIEQVVPGMKVLADGDWAEVKSWTDVGEKPVLHIELDNGLVLRCTEDHKVFKVPKRAGGRSGKRGDEVEIRAGDLRAGDDLLQPERLPFGVEHLSEDEATIIGAYVAGGWLEPTRVSITGRAGGKDIREKVIAAAERLVLPVSVDAFKVRIMDRGWVERLRRDCGEFAHNKHFPHTNFDEETTRLLLSMLEADAHSPARSRVKTATFFTTSEVLARQYRIMYRRLGQSCSTRKLPPKHAGQHEVFQVHVRQSNGAEGRKYWARVKRISMGPSENVFDIETSTRRFYLPDSDVVVHNCVPEKDAKKEAEALFYEVQKRVRYTWDPTDYDAFQTPAKTLALRAGDCDDAVSLLGALLRSVGHKVRTRVVQTKGQSTWNHIYLLVNINGQWMPLDTTVKQPPGWEVPPDLVVRKQDFDVVDGQAGPKLNT
jgi:hypothetical protein